MSREVEVAVVKKLSSVGFSLVTLASLISLLIGQDHRAIASPSFKNWGLVNSQAASHIGAPDAWKLEKGSRQIIVAVIDTGIDPNHPLLKNNLWKDPENHTTFGWNFVTNQPNPIDQHGHGTHVAGIVGAASDSENGVSGVAPNISVMAIKYYADTNPGSVNLRNTVRAIDYAVSHGARIINYSGGGPEFSEEEYAVIKRAEAKGILFVAAAGNEKSDVDQVQNYYYPAAYRLSNIISVAAINVQNNLIPSSNWGKSNVDVAAPGENIYSTLPNGRFGYMTGTSQATAFVSGIAALLLSKNPNLTASDLKKIITSSAHPVPGLADKVIAGGNVNAYQALASLSNYSKTSSWVARRSDTGRQLFSLPIESNP